MPTGWRLWLRRLFLWGGGVALLGLLFVVVSVLFAARSLPSYEELKASQTGQTIIVRARDGTELIALGPSYGEWLDSEQIPQVMKDAMIAVEDQRFHSHFGFDPIRLTGAVVEGLTGDDRIGGTSTITQQLARNVFLNSNRTLDRKAREAVLAMALEWKFSKEQILELYLNKVYFGGGAYGIDSASRRFFSHPATDLSTGEAAIIAGLAHELPHEGVAWEIFYPAGPFALLPLRDDDQGRHRSALVWTVAEKDAAGIMALSPRAFLHEVGKRMDGLYGKVELVGDRSSYPLSFQHTVRMTDHRMALVGDAAHGMHPIAGQGLNLGLRDVGALVEVLAESRRLGLDLGDAEMLRRYEQWRGLDTFSVSFATDVLTRLFGVPGKAASAVRRFGMGGVQRLPLLKRWFMDEARGVSGNVPELMRA